MIAIIISIAIIAAALAWLAWRMEHLKQAVARMEEERKAQDERVENLKEQIAALKPQVETAKPCVAVSHPAPLPKAHSQTGNAQPNETPYAKVFYLAQNQDDIFVNFNSLPQPGSIFKAIAATMGDMAGYEPINLNFLQCRDHFKAISLTADSCLTDEATTFETVTPGIIKKCSDSGHTFWEIKQRVLVRLRK